MSNRNSDLELPSEDDTTSVQSFRSQRNKRKRQQTTPINLSDDENTSSADTINSIQGEFETAYAEINRRTIKVSDCEKLRVAFYKLMTLATNTATKNASAKSAAVTAESIISGQSKSIQSIEELLSSTVLPMLSQLAKNAGLKEQPTNNSDRPTFSSVVKRRPAQPKRQADHPLIINPKQKQTSANTKDDFTNFVDPVSNNFGFTRLREARNGSVVIGLQDPTDMQRIKDKLINDRGFTAQYEIREPKKRDPRVILYSIPKTISDEDLSQQIYDQNLSIQDLYSDFPSFKAAHRFLWHSKAKDTNNERNIVIEAKPLLRRLLIKIQRIKLGFQMIRVEDHILITRCFNCCGLGHRSSGKLPNGQPIKCPHTTLVCSHCTGPHRFKDCPTKADKSKAVCHNCHSENARNKNTRLKTNHNAFAHECPILRRYLESEFNRTDYVC